MSLSDLQAANLGLIGAVFEAVTSSTANAADAANLMFENDFQLPRLVDDPSAANVTNELVLTTVARRCTLVSASFEPASATALNADANNYAAITIQSRAAANAAAPLVLSTTNTTPTANGGTGNMSQWNTVSLTVTPFNPTNTVIPAGGKLTVKIAKAGTGVIVPAGTITARVRYL